MAQYGQYTKWAALGLFVVITLMGQRWGIGGALASFLALALFATLYALEETAAIRAAELKKKEEEEARRAAEEEAAKKASERAMGEADGPAYGSDGSIALKATIFNRADDEKKLFEAARDGRLDEVTRLVEEGTLVDAQNANGLTPLMFAVKFGHVAVAHYLIEQGADVNQKSKSGITAMRIARELKKTELIELLSAGGALD